MDNLQMFSFLKKLVIDEQKKLLAIFNSTLQYHGSDLEAKYFFIRNLFFLSTGKRQNEIKNYIFPFPNYSIVSTILGILSFK